MKKILGVLLVSYILFGAVVAWLVWDSLRQNGFSGESLYVRFALIIGIFIALSIFEFGLKYKMGMNRTLLIRSVIVGVGVALISFIMGYKVMNAIMWGIIFGFIYYFWDRSKMLRINKLNNRN